MSSDVKTDLGELLPVYYSRLFPLAQFHKWLTCDGANPNGFTYREMSFVLPGDVYVRYLSFDTLQDFEKELIRKCPEKIDIGAVYNTKPRLKRMAGDFEVVEKELVFDIDMTDYDSVRNCCSEADICPKCWRLVSTAVTIIHTALTEDFGFKHLLWVFSGRRGVHCWVSDELARTLESKPRSDLAEYLQLLTREDSTGKTVHLPTDKPLHPSIRRALEIIDKDFVKMCVEEQDMLGTPKRMATVLGMLSDDNLKSLVSEAWERSSSSVERWQDLERIFKQQLEKGNLKSWRRYLLEELKLHFAYPRLDINVTKGSNHLLKSPFCVHPKTGKVCVPFNPLAVHKFNPTSVPTLPELIDEIQSYDLKKAQGGELEPGRKVKDYRKTGLNKAVHVFEEFLRRLHDETEKNKRIKLDDQGMDF